MSGLSGLIAVLRSPILAALVGLGWIALPLVGAQIPQHLAPTATTDGLSRADMIAAAGHGLDRIGDSTMLWLLIATTLILALARWMLGGARGDVTSIPFATADGDRLARLEASLREAVSGGVLGSLAAVRLRGPAERRELVCGQAVAGRWIAAMGAIVALGVCMTAARRGPPVLLDVPVTGPGTPRPIVGKQAVHGRLVPTAGHFEARCEAANSGLSCTIEALGDRRTVELVVGESTSLGAHSVTWVATAPNPQTGGLGLRWRAPGPEGAAQLYAFDVTRDRHSDVPALALKLSTFGTARSGPILIGARGGAQPAALIAAGPALLPSAAPSLRGVPAPQVRLLVGPSTSRVAPLLALLLLTIGCGLAFGVPSASVVVDRDAAMVRVAANRDDLRRRLALAAVDAHGPGA